MRYCNTCLYPDTKPDLYFIDGKCSACIAFEARKNKNWNMWANTFDDIVKRNKKHSVYDCIIPVSGGKDSHYQVIKIIGLGYNPLCVCARTDDLTPLGRQNLDNIAKLGVDLIEINVNNKLRKRIAKYALETIGDISWCEHVLIFTVPFNIACQYGIPLIIYGENPQNEYGAGPKGTEDVLELGYEWLQEFGGLNGLRVDDILNAGIGSGKQMFPYRMPDGYYLDVIEPKAYFLGQFFPWDGSSNAHLAAQYGFKFADHEVEGTSIKYENLDNFQTGVHDYFKYIKFGFGRTTDIVSNKIRRGHMSRQKAKSTIIHHDGMHPVRYMGRNLMTILSDIDMGLGEFNVLVHKFANKDLFDCSSGQWPKPKFWDYLTNA